MVYGRLVADVEKQKLKQKRTRLKVSTSDVCVSSSQAHLLARLDPPRLVSTPACFAFDPLVSKSVSARFMCVGCAVQFSQTTEICPAESSLKWVQFSAGPSRIDRPWLSPANTLVVFSYLSLANRS